MEKQKSTIKGDIPTKIGASVIGAPFWLEKRNQERVHTKRKEVIEKGERREYSPPSLF